LVDGVLVAASDTVTFSSLIDDQFGDLTSKCDVDTVDGAPLAPSVNLDGFELDPGHTASCTINLPIQGNAGDSHVNVAIIYGTDEDGDDVQATDDETVTFDPSAPDTDMAFATSMLVVIELTNASEVDNVTLTGLTVQGLNVVDGAGNSEFTILNSVGGTYNSTFYPACNVGPIGVGEELGYSGSGSNVYACAFTIELKPGLENTNDINFIAQGALNGIVATVTDDEGDTFSNYVSVQVITDE